MSSAAVNAENRPAVLARAEIKTDKKEEASYNRLRSEALDALSEYRRCVELFDYVSDEKLIDVSIYNIQSAMSRYEYLLQNLKRISR